jgi:DNA-binding HxlR family transcriptional regulator
VADQGDYCAFTKAVEHLGDRWSLVIIRELSMYGCLGFNALAGGLPGISRSVLAARLRKLEDLGLVTRDDGDSETKGYTLTYAGRELRPVLSVLHQWSARFVPEDPAMVERDPDIVIMWLARRLDPDQLPEHRTVMELDISGSRARKAWLVLERGAAPSVCIEDPCLPAERYVFVSSDVQAIDHVARGLAPLSDAVAAGTVQLDGEPALVRDMASWLRASEPDDRSNTRRPGRAPASTVAAAAGS